MWTPAPPGQLHTEHAQLHGEHEDHTGDADRRGDSGNDQARCEASQQVPSHFEIMPDVAANGLAA
jgi:hypothetical protein